MAKKPGEVVAEQVRYFRGRREWTQEELAQRLDELGIPGWRQSKIAKIERGEARRLPIDDVFELALALGCPPVMLLAPNYPDPRTMVEVAPGHAFQVGRVRGWIRGRDPLTPEGLDEDEKRRVATWYFLEFQPWQDWTFGDEDFRFSAMVKRAQEAREQLLEENIARYEADIAKEDGNRG